MGTLFDRVTLNEFACHRQLEADHMDGESHVWIPRKNEKKMTAQTNTCLYLFYLCSDTVSYGVNSSLAT